MGTLRSTAQLSTDIYVHVLPSGTPAGSAQSTAEGSCSTTQRTLPWCSKTGFADHNGAHLDVKVPEEE
jgi:hypothetical protein